MTTKLDIVDGPYEQLRICGQTTNRTPGELQLALKSLEAMMNDYRLTWNRVLGDQFQTTPTYLIQTGVDVAYNPMMEWNLAVRLIPAFGKTEVPDWLPRMAAQSLSAAIGNVAAFNLRDIQAPRRMPLGYGNTYRGVFWNRYTVPIANAPVSGFTNYILQGETFDYTESYVAWLAGNTIVSFTMVCDPMLTITASSQSAGVISYTINCPTTPPAIFPPLQLVQITVTDSAGRIDIRQISFQVTTP